MMRKRERGEIRIDSYDFFVITMVSSIVLSAFSYNIEPTIATPKSQVLVLPSTILMELREKITALNTF